ncbi:hypothetical protein TNCT_680371 [Trichonephila clavata]|uniref:Uncharacterized protein n=1 Tax=Trichonephila clavata TaxID=2740835 RepID=A0A8X6IKJ5_TRICU|nr:hypothetical protein TNCT_680371 [Trichonephila clavata]
MCVKTTCPSLVLQDGLLEYKDDCSTKSSGEVCQVACKNVIGKNIMRCLEGFQWSEQPHCAYYKPNVLETH